jgi:hypothetical protein
MNTENEVVATENTVHVDTGAVVHDTVADASNVAADASAPTVKATKVPKVKGTPGRPREVTSALSRARVIYIANPSAARADVVAKFIADGIAKPIANTYYHLIQKTLKK